MANLIQIQANIPWACTRTNSGNWVAVCEPLKLTSQADTWAELMEDIGLTLDAIMRDLFISNELDKFLRDKGWQLVGTLPDRREDARFDVPFIPAIVAANGSERNLYQ
jgi:hypothetical protein